MENTEIPKTKKLNKANLPFLTAAGMFIAGILLMILSIVTESVILMCITAIFNLAAIILIPLLCIIGLVFQILIKKKSLFDKVMLSLNSIVILFMISLVVLACVAFPNEFKGEKDVREQINQEYSTLESEYNPVLEYLADYKKANGVYPASIDDNIIPKSGTFDMYKYHNTSDGKGYWLQVYPKNGPIEYFYNDENDNGYNYYHGNGYIDGFLDNDYYYEIDETWHAIMLQHFTRHGIFWQGGSTERETDELMKDNIEKFENKK